MWWIILIVVIGVAAFLLWPKRNNQQNHIRRSEPTFSADIDEPETAEVELEPQQITSTPKPQPQDFIVIRVIADPEQQYSGYELLQSLLANGFRFGKMNIFHRHEQANGDGEILFSLASATEPGTFDLEQMGQTFCKGLTLFMAFEDQKNLPKTFNLMLETAKQLTEDLGGTLYDDSNRKLNSATMEKWRAKIKIYQDSKYTYDLFDEPTKIKDLQVGDKARIITLRSDNRAYRKKLLEMGLTKNTEFEVIRKAPLGDPIVIKFRDCELILRQDEAAILEVEKVE